MVKKCSKLITQNTGSKIIAITGTTSGIGKAIARKFKQENWQVIELSLPDFDVRNVEQIQNLKLPKLDVFVNNAGIMPLIDFEKTKLEDWEDIINTNLRGPFFLSQKVIPLIKNKGHLINIASISGIYPEKEFIVYSISKAGIIMLTQCLAKRYGERIFINSISPGYIRTKLTGQPLPQKLIDTIPMKRVAEPEEVADLVWFIVNNKYLNGTNIIFDNGLFVKYYGP